MKIIHINSYDGNGGAGRACIRLDKALKQEGIQSEIWVNYKFGNDHTIKSFNKGGFRKMITAFGILAERFISSFISKPIKIPFSYPFWGTDITKNKELQEADIIHLHWINHGFLRPKDLQKIAKLNKPIVWTFHDSNAFTGGCHVRYSCDHYEHECGNCPVLKTSNPSDASHDIWLQKNRAYKQLSFNIISPSNWMGGAASKSGLLKGFPVHVIPNTLETTVFNPHDKDISREFLGLSKDKFLILSGFMPSRNDLHKGTPYLIEALELLTKRVPAQKIELVVFGNRDNKNVPNFPVKTTFLGTISNDEKLAYCYSAVDVFLTPSLDDNLPNTVMESLACGTPVVSFTTGGIPDMVRHLTNGYLAEYKNSDDLANGLAWVLETPEKEILRRNASKIVRENFSETIVARKHIILYEQLLAKEPFEPVLSVITVVYNNVKDIERTVLSVINQTYSKIQYIIIDGNSNDGTIDIIKEYDQKIAKWVSEKDHGIYDAMNKGLALATGDYVIFMNSGDEFYSPDTVSDVFSSSSNADIYYGETEMYNENWENLGKRRHVAPETFTYKSFRFGMSVSHQAIYIKRSLAKPYNLNYQLSSDIDWILEAVKNSSKIVNTRKYVAKYMVGGMSKKRHRQSLKERFNIFTKHYGLIPNLLNHFVIAANLAFYYFKHRRTND
ncbi:glycosyltransferase [Pedobacter sp. HMF7647]|uniref:Glycosyltransferase n=1 Tax=Hufsiella arboris TaxID=2695275 RepID=A0A7K1YAP4_9SPHI|nr:glycosyltransferase [Hufsiella arboris]